MSIQTNISFLNARDPKFKRAQSGSPQEQEEWQEDNGSFLDRPGVVLESNGHEDGVYETDDEYGGWVIELACIPENTTHILITRS